MGFVGFVFGWYVGPWFVVPGIRRWRQMMRIGRRKSEEISDGDRMRKLGGCEI